MKNLNSNAQMAGRLVCVAVVLVLVIASVSAAEKPRLFVLTDIGGDPDDQMSMVRLMTYANHIDIEGLVANRRGQDVRIQRIVEAYGKVRDNLELHEPGFPKADELMACIAEGRSAKDFDAAAKVEAEVADSGGGSR